MMNELIEIVKDISDMLDNDFNFDDYSVGIYSIGKVDKNIIEWVEEIEGIIVQSYDAERMDLLIDNKYIVLCELKTWYDGIDYDSRWEVSNAYKLKGVAV
jgi:hypothetical protein